MSGFADIVSAQAESLIVEDLRLPAGSSWNVGWTVSDSAGTLVDFSSGTAQMSIKDKVGGTVLATFSNTLTGGKQIVLTNGTVSVAATPSATSGFATTSDYSGVYDIKVTVGSSTVTLVRGTMYISAGVTP